MTEDPFKRYQSLEQKFPIRTVDVSTHEAFLRIGPEILELWNLGWNINPPWDIDRLEKYMQGSILGVMYDGEKMIGMVMTRIEAEPDGHGRMLRGLPSESLNADGTAIHPDYRGIGLQKVLLLSRLDIARKFKKETILSSVRLENGASLRNIVSTGARILAYSPNYFPWAEQNPGRLIWEYDLTAPKSPDEETEKLDGAFPDIVLSVRSDDRLDLEGQKAAADLLSGNYVIVSVKSAEKDSSQTPKSNKLIFRHLSIFPAAISERLYERKKKILEILTSQNAG